MERPVQFITGSETLRGVLHAPATPWDAAGDPVGVVFLHGWSGTRHGPHRMFVTLARQLADAGFHSLRFDFRGRGESDGETADTSISGMIDDTRRAVDFLLAETPVRTIVLLGICSAGKVAIGEACADARIGGLVLWSAEAMGYLRGGTARATKSAHALSDYLRKLARLETWRKILTGRVHTDMVRKAVLATESPTRTESGDESILLDRFKTFNGRILFVYGGNDPETAIAADRYRGFCTQHGIPHAFYEIAEANHSFYSLTWEQQVMDLTEQWLDEYRRLGPGKRASS